MNIKFKIGIEEYNKFVELIGGVKIKVDSPLIINSPTFNTKELPYGSLIQIDKGYIQLQGFVADINPKILTVAYYDPESFPLWCSHETLDIDRVVSGEYKVELIRKALSRNLD